LTQQSLKRSITWVQGTALTIGAVLGCGILILPSITANSAGPASILSWVIMSILAFPIVATLARLAKMIPSAGGITAYVQMAFNANTSAILGWIMLGSIPIGVPIIALTGAHYIGYVFPISNLSVIGIAALILITSLLLHIKGIELSSKVSVFVICIISLLIVVAVIVSIPYVKLSSFTPFVPNGWSSVGASSVIIFFSFVGWEMITPLAEEFKRPAKDISISLFLGAICISIMYIAISFVTIGTHSYGDKDQIASLSILISKGLGPIGTYITTILAIFISFSAVHANIAGFSRMIYAQAREGHFPSFFAKLHSQFQTPTRVLLVLGGIFSCILIFYGMARPNLEMLLKGPSVIFITSYIFTMLAALKLLKVRDIGWWMAFLSLIICIIVYSFSGWAIFYPVILSIIGWIYIVMNKKYSTITNHQVNTSNEN